MLYYIIIIIIIIINIIITSIVNIIISITVIIIMSNIDIIIIVILMFGSISPGEPGAPSCSSWPGPGSTRCRRWRRRCLQRGYIYTSNRCYTLDIAGYIYTSNRYCRRRGGQVGRQAGSRVRFLSCFPVSRAVSLPVPVFLRSAQGAPSNTTGIHIGQTIIVMDEKCTPLFHALALPGSFGCRRCRLKAGPFDRHGTAHPGSGLRLPKTSRPRLDSAMRDSAGRREGRCTEPHVRGAWETMGSILLILPMPGF